MSGIFRFSASDFPQPQTGGADVANAFSTSFYRAQENLRQNGEAGRQEQRFAMEQERFAAQQEELDYERTLRPLKEQQLRLGMASNLLTIQTQGASLTFKQGEVRAQQMELAANTGVLQSFGRNQDINDGIKAAIELYGGAPQQQPQSSPSNPADTAMRQAGVSLSSAGGQPVDEIGIPTKDRTDEGANPNNPLLPPVDQGQAIRDRVDTMGANFTQMDQSQASTAPAAAPGASFSPEITNRMKLAKAYMEADSITKMTLEASGNRITPAVAAMIQQTQSIQLAALSDPETRKIIETMQSEKTKAQMNEDLSGLPPVVSDYIRRVIPDPSINAPKAVSDAQLARRAQVDDYLRNPNGWLSSHGLAVGSGMTQSQRIATVKAWLQNASAAVGNDPQSVRQFNVLAQQALNDPNVELPLIAATPVESSGKPASRLDIVAYYAALRREAEAMNDSSKLAEIARQEAEAIKNPSSFRAEPAEIVAPSSRFRKAVGR